jgi:hypothetical protein
MPTTSPSLSEKERIALRTTSIEHLISTTIRLLARLRTSTIPSIAEDADTTWRLWREHQDLIIKLWKEAAVTSFRLQTKGEHK